MGTSYPVILLSVHVSGTLTILKTGRVGDCGGTRSGTMFKREEGQSSELLDTG